MRNIFGGFVVAFSMYSKIPMPKRNWTKENMQYAMCFFPLVGLVIACVAWFWTQFCMYQGISWVLYSAGMVLIPMAISGGIHMDGFCDTIDALSSHQSRERKLEILKDPHIGAFGTMGCVLYILVMFALYAEIGMSEWSGAFIGISFVISRSLSGLSVVSFKNAKADGTLASFSSMAGKRVVKGTLIIYLLACIVALPLLLIGSGSLIIMALAVDIAAILAFLYYRYISYKEFGGITGDLAGFFLQICEMMIAIAICVVAKMY